MGVNCAANYLTNANVPAWIIGIVGPIYTGIAKPLALMQDKRVKAVLGVIDAVGGLAVAGCLIANGFSSAADLSQYTLGDSQTWNDFYFRANDGDSYSDASRRNGAPSSSPDILIVGSVPLSTSDIQGYQSDMTKDTNNNILYNSPNLFYLRGKAISAISETSTLRLYHVQSNLILNPSMWLYISQAQAQTIDGNDHLDIPVIPQGNICIPTAFKWINPDAPSSGNHYCMISWLSTPQHPSPPDDQYTADGWAEFINENPNFGWRNTSYTNSNSPTDSFELNSEINLTGFTSNTTVLITLTGPVGWDVALQVEKPDANGNIVKIDRTTLQAGSDTQGIFIKGTFPPGFVSSVTYQYWTSNSTSGTIVITPNIQSNLLFNKVAKYGRSVRFLSNNRFEYVNPSQTVKFGPMKRLVALGSVLAHHSYTPSASRPSVNSLLEQLYSK